MGNQIIALKNKSNGMVSVGIPVFVFIFFGGYPIDDQIAAVIPVETANDIQKSGFSSFCQNFPKKILNFLPLLSSSGWQKLAVTLSVQSILLVI